MQSGARRGPRRPHLVIVLALVLWGLLTHGTHAGTGDEPHYLAIAHSIAFDGDLDLSNNYGRAEPMIADGQLEPEAHVRAGVGGISRPVHDVGMPLLFAPYVRVMLPLVRWVSTRLPPRMMQRARLTPPLLYRHVLSAAMIAVTCLLACMLFDTFLALGGTSWPAFGTTLLVILSPPLLIHSILFFTEVVSAVLCFWVFRQLVLREGSTTAAWVMAGAACGLLLLVHIRNAGIVAALLVLAARRLFDDRSRARAVGFAAAFVALVVVRTWINYRFWGTLLTGPHAAGGVWTGIVPVLQESGTRIAAWLVDQEFGLLPYAPVYLISAAGLVALTRRQRALGASIVFVCGAYVLSIALPFINVHGWTGGWSPPARFLLPVLPLAALAMPDGLRTLPSALVTLLVVVQAGMDAYAWQNPKILWNDGDGRAAACAKGIARVCDYVPSFVNLPPRR